MWSGFPKHFHANAQDLRQALNISGLNLQSFHAIVPVD
jgi:hypothetical protein